MTQATMLADAPTTTTAATDVDAQLEELEKKLDQGQ